MIVVEMFFSALDPPHNGSLKYLCVAANEQLEKKQERGKRGL